jgi:hypothetical protein
MSKKFTFTSIEDLDQQDVVNELQMDEQNPLDNSFKSGIYTYLNWFYDGEQDDFLL